MRKNIYQDNCKNCDKKCCEYVTSTNVINVIYNYTIPPNNLDININNTIFVDAQYGNDLTGLRENLDFPFQTISAALLVALPEDLIYVWPGDYLVESLLIVQNQNFFFNLGTIVTSTGDMFQVNSPITLNVTGEGEFNTPSGFSQIYTNTNDSIINFKGFKSTVYSFLLSNSGNSKINIDIDYIYILDNNSLNSYVILSLTGILNLYLNFVECIAVGGLLYCNIMSSGIIIINGEYLEINTINNINIIDVKSPNVVVETEINETVIQSNSQLLNVDIIDEILTRVYFKGDSVTTIAQLLSSRNVLNGNVILEIANISADILNGLKFIQCNESTVQIDNETFKILSDSVYTVVDVRNKSNFSMKSSHFVVIESQLLLYSSSLEDDCEISLDINYFESNSSLFNLEGNVTCSAKFDKIAILNQLSYISQVSDGVLLYFDCNDISIITDSITPLGIFVNNNSQTYFNFDKIYANVIRRLFYYNFSTYSSCKFDNINVVTNSDFMLYCSNSLLDIEIGNLQMSDNKTIFYIEKSEANIEINSTLNIGSRLLRSDDATISVRLNDVNTSFYNLLLNDVGKSIHVYFNSIVYTGLSVINGIFIESTGNVNLYLEGDLLDLGKSREGVLTSGNSIFRANIKKVLYGLGNSGFFAWQNSKMYLELNEYNATGSTFAFNIQDNAYISVNIVRMLLVGGNIVGFNIIENGSLDAKVKYCTAPSYIIFSTTDNTVSYHTKNSNVTNGYMFFLDITGGLCRYVFGGYMRSSLQLINMFSPPLALNTPRIAFLSSTIVCASNSLFIATNIGVLIQMEPSIANKTDGAQVTIIPTGVLFINPTIF